MLDWSLYSLSVKLSSLLLQDLNLRRFGGSEKASMRILGCLFAKHTSQVIIRREFGTDSIIRALAFSRAAGIHLPVVDGYTRLLA